jgi:hypothetical protein
MIRKILAYGVIAGLIVGVPLFGVTVTAKDHLDMPGMALTYLVMLIALSTVFVAIKRRRDMDLGGVIRFWPAVGFGLGISLVAGIVYVVAWESAIAISHFDFAAGYAKAMIAEQQAKGVSAEALAKFTAQMEEFKVQYANPLFRLPMIFIEIFPVGVLVSLVSAGLLRNSRFFPARRAG